MCFLYFVVDGARYECNKNGVPIVKKRQSPRITMLNEANTERAHLRNLARLNVNLKETEAYKWLATKLKRPTWPETTALGRLLSNLFQIPMPREAYRRANTTLYWFHENWDIIKNIFQTHKITALHSLKGEIYFLMPMKVPPVVTVVARYQIY